MAGSGTGHDGMQVRSLLSGFEVAARGFDFGGFLLAELDDMIDEILVVEAIGRRAVKIDLAVSLARAAAGKAEIGFAGFARTVHDAADDRQRHGRGDVL